MNSVWLARVALLLACSVPLLAIYDRRSLRRAAPVRAGLNPVLGAEGEPEQDAQHHEQRVGATCLQKCRSLAEQAAPFVAFGTLAVNAIGLGVLILTLLAGQAQVAQEFASNRAAMFVSQINGAWAAQRLPNADLGLGLGIGLQWTNGANRGTRQLKMATSCLLAPPGLQDPFDVDAWNGTQIPYYFGPHQVSGGPPCAAFVSFQDVALINAGVLARYVVGLARYRDETSPGWRITEYSVEITHIELSNPPVPVGFAVGTHNCADEDCPDYRAQVARAEQATAEPRATAP